MSRAKSEVQTAAEAMRRHALSYVETHEEKATKAGAPCTWPLLVVLLALCTSCGGDEAGSTSSPDGGLPDGNPSNPFEFCYDYRVVDLAAEGVQSNGATEYQGSNVDAPTPLSLLSQPCAEPEALHVVPHAYRMASRARLRASAYAANAYVWVQTTCPATKADCHQNFLASPGDPAVVLSSDVFEAGARVFILLSSGDLGGGAPGGDYRLVVEEVDSVPVGEACDPSQVADPCVAGASCVALSRYQGFDYDLSIDVRPTRGVCVADGTEPRSRCRADKTCDAPMSCQNGTCLVEGAADVPCSFDACYCPAGLLWLPTDTTNPFAGTCKADGQPGGDCKTDSVKCDVGVCGTYGTCSVQVAAGGACDPFKRSSECQGQAACLAQGSLANSVCVPYATGPGAPCSLAGGTCYDGSLSCVDSVCVRTPASGEPCFPRQRQDACPAGEICAATDFLTATCRKAAVETNEPNGSPVEAGTALSLPAALSGTLSPDDGRDCYAIAVPQGGSVYAELNDGRDGCPDYSIRSIELYNPERGLLEGSRAYVGPCEIIDGSQALSAARDLTAGTYTVCVIASGNDSSGPELPYHLNIAVH